jgi:hypothetical protein
VRLYIIASTQFDRIDRQLSSDLVHQTLECEKHLRAAKTTDQTARYLIGHDHPIAYGQVPDVVRPGQSTMHAIERCGLGRSQVGTDLIDLVIVERRDPTLRIHRSRETSLTRRCRCRRLQMLKPVFNPLHRCARLSGGQTHQHDIGEDRMLDPEASARIPRNPMAQPITRDL